MCQHIATHHPAEASSNDFPWDAGVYDAHCHPTDTMASVSSIPLMRATALAIMSTRSQDQELVAAVAAEHGIRREDTQGVDHNQTGSAPSQRAGQAIPSFGWHPWFSYQLYDDTAPAAPRTYDAESAKGDGIQAERLRHFTAVLSPPPSDEASVANMPPIKSLSEFIEETRVRLRAHPIALVGEVGLDKRFRLPEPWKDGESRPNRDDDMTPGGRDGRLLSRHHVKMSHQVAVLKAQLKLAAEMGRAVSVHGVQAHGVLFETLSECWKGHEREVLSKKERRKIAEGAEDFSSSSDDSDDDGNGRVASGGRQEPRPYPPRICLHSFSGPPEVMKQYLNPKIPAKVFVSFSMAINVAMDEKRAGEVIAACPGDRILVESDLHIAGEEMDAALEGMYRKVCEIKGWGLRDGVDRIGRNFKEFIGGSW